MKKNKRFKDEIDWFLRLFLFSHEKERPQVGVLLTDDSFALELDASAADYGSALLSSVSVIGRFGRRDGAQIVLLLLPLELLPRCAAQESAGTAREASDERSDLTFKQKNTNFESLNQHI